MQCQGDRSKTGQFIRSLTLYQLNESRFVKHVHLALLGLFPYCFTLIEDMYVEKKCKPFGFIGRKSYG